MVREPALRFTIPSLHDGLSLDCRIYHPASLAAINVRAASWKKQAAVVAHPYGPMGGCYDDGVLGSVAARLLGAGYLVGTFNFRGAGHSAGRTSWTARPERDDYASMVGFTAYYVHFLDASAWPGRQDKEEADADADADADAEEPTTTTTTTATERRPLFAAGERPWLLMGGYSYGAMVTTQLPLVEELLSPFSSPEANSHAAQIRLRAQHLAEQQSLMLGGMRAAMLQVRNPRHAERRHSGEVRIGGEEGGPSPRRSHDGHGRSGMSLDAEDWIRAKRQGGASPTKHPGGEQEPQPERLPAVSHFVHPRPAYLLVSPLRGLVAHLATMSLLSAAGRSHSHDDAAEKKLVENPTLAVFGDKDVFVPVGKLRTWAAGLSAGRGSRFTAWEVAGAGHFWAEEGVLQSMKERTKASSKSLQAYR
ncbi:hypothetical protein E4U42_004077 [Claviceps africana]|uniref:Prolyl oligopeptidase n=1 Tax=Claviceps africana TaxID=83212 RepID=A0A8K0NLI3_9HYPO|nr:hypothetical protein E4U42_004077 [Claviceps africana]